MYLCGPAKFYLILIIISTFTYLCISYKQNKHNKSRFQKELKNGILMPTLFSLIWVMIINWVCHMRNGNTIAWILVFLPVILWMFMLLSIIVLFKLS